MKKLLFIAATLVLTASCERLQLGGQYVEPIPEEIISLSAGAGATVSRTNTSGFREEFKEGDQIALFAAYTPVAGELVWTTTDAEADSIAQVGPYFLNAPASCVTPATTKSAVSTGAKFAWGPNGEATLEWSKIYPKNTADIQIFGYYPYNSDADTVAVGAQSGKPEYLIALRADGTEGDSTYTSLGQSPNKQDDILWVQAQSAAGHSNISRADVIAPLTFKHALAQVDFQIKLAENATQCVFKSIAFTVPRYGKMDITSGAIQIQKAGPELTREEQITYNITRASQMPVPTTATSVFSGNEEDYLMIMPMTAEETKDLQLAVTVSYSPTGTSELLTYPIALESSEGTALLSAIEAGKRAKITLTVLQTGISIEADIEEWNPEGSENNLDVE